MPPRARGIWRSGVKHARQLNGVSDHLTTAPKWPLKDVYRKQQETDPSALAATASDSTIAIAKAKANINLRIHLTSPAALTVPASGLAQKERGVKNRDDDVHITKPGGFPKVAPVGMGYCANMLTDPLNAKDVEL